MYNPQKVIDLLQSSGAKNRDLLDFMGKNWNGSVAQVINGDIRVSKLEKIADFFGVPVDYFFDRDQDNFHLKIGGVLNHIHDFHIGPGAENTGAMARILKEKEALIIEKDKRIELLEDMVEFLKGSRKEHESLE